MKVITIVGDSLFRRYMDRNSVLRTTNIGRDYENVETQFDRLEDVGGINTYNNSKYEIEIDHIKDVMSNLWMSEVQHLSCEETQSIYEIANDPNITHLEVNLIATDNLTSVIACISIRDWINSKGEINGVSASCSFTLHDNGYTPYRIIQGLQVNNLTFLEQEGIPTLYRAVEYLISELCILNISGAHKSLFPLLVLLGADKELPVKYLVGNFQPVKRLGKNICNLRLATV